MVARCIHLVSTLCSPSTIPVLHRHGTGAGHSISTGPAGRCTSVGSGRHGGSTTLSRRQRTRTAGSTSGPMARRFPASGLPGAATSRRISVRCERGTAGTCISRRTDPRPTRSGICMRVISGTALRLSDTQMMDGAAISTRRAGRSIACGSMTLTCSTRVSLAHAMSTGGSMWTGRVGQRTELDSRWWSPSITEPRSRKPGRETACSSGRTDEFATS